MAAVPCARGRSASTWAARAARASHDPPPDPRDEASIAAAAASLGDGPRLVIDATGFLYGEGFAPETAPRRLDPADMAHGFAINAIGPALLMKHFPPAWRGRSALASATALAALPFIQLYPAAHPSHAITT